MNLPNVLATGLLATLGFAVAAQTSSSPPMSTATAPVSSGRTLAAERQERFAQRLAELRQQLQIMPTQEAAWTSFANALRPSDRPRQDPAALARLSTPERIDQMRALRHQRVAQMDRRGEATKAFYAMLEPHQKKLFDETTARPGRLGWRHLKGG